MRLHTCIYCMKDYKHATGLFNHKRKEHLTELRATLSRMLMTKDEDKIDSFIFYKKEGVKA